MTSFDWSVKLPTYEYRLTARFWIILNMKSLQTKLDNYSHHTQNDINPIPNEAKDKRTRPNGPVRLS
mgnify:CR=1 FL=1